jgi:membrane dipeptidase
MLLFDAHLDLSMNALQWNRDYTRPLEEVRRREAHLDDKPDRGRGVASFPEMRRGKIGLCVATQIARYVAEGNPLPGWNSPEIAWAVTQGQLAWYRAMEDAGQLVQIVDRRGLNRQAELWLNDPPADAPIGYILSLEGADSILTPHHLERAYAQGLRALGPAHYGPGRYAPGTGEEGGLEPQCRELLVEMRRLNMILDVTHLTDKGFWEALELFDGPVWASHSNVRTLVPHQRQLPDDQIRTLIERGAVIGAAFDAWMMVPHWVRGKTRPDDSGVRISWIAEHIDHICQIAGNARHCGIGSDLDGGYGTEQTATDLHSIADLQKLVQIDSRRSRLQPAGRGEYHAWKLDSVSE